MRIAREKLVVFFTYYEICFANITKPYDLNIDN